MVRKRVFVSGRVQGVGYRHSAHQAASELGLRGWVRNRRDGRVEALVEGEQDAVERFLRWCHEGPPAARVEQVDSADDPGGEPLGAFDVERTA